MGATVIHFEVVGKDGPALQSFYSKVFDWNLDTSNPGGYGMYRPPSAWTLSSTACGSSAWT